MLDHRMGKGVLLSNEGVRMKWKRGKPLAKGSYATVYLATNMTTTCIADHHSSYHPSLMAVKTSKLSDSTTLENEQHIISRLRLPTGRSHPNIIRSYGHSINKEEDDHNLYYNLFFEYASGGTISDRINSTGGRGLPEPEVRRYTRSILRGLEHIHRRNFVHCDIKPDNILLVKNVDHNNTSTTSSGDDYTVKIADFGLAKKAGIVEEYEDDDDYYFSFRGTPSYLAPECILDKKHETPCDVWALGLSIIEMLSGRNIAWDAINDTFAMFDEITSGEVSATEQLASEVSEDARDFVNKCLVPYPANRATATELLKHPFVSTIASKLISGVKIMDGGLMKDDECERLR